MSSTICGYKLLCSAEGYYISYKSGKLFKCRDLNDKPELITRLKLSRLSYFRLVVRALRLEPRTATSIGAEQIILSHRGAIYNIDIHNNCVQREHLFRKGMNNPLSFCVTDEPTRRILYGEYWTNMHKERVCIFERNDRGSWEECFAFNAGEITHIHQIVYDKFRKCFWILTGDADNESAIWRANNDFSEVKAIFRGSQIYRSCVLVPEDEGLLYATDTPLENNAIYYIPIEENSILPPQRIYDMPGPCIYGKSINKNLCAFSTSVEPDSSLPTWRYYLTSKLGNGVKSRNSYIVAGNSKDGFKKIFNARKDRWNMSFFQFGNIQFPDIEANKKLFCTGQALRGIDGKTVIIEI